MNSTQKLTPFPVRHRTTTGQTTNQKPAITVAKPYPFLDAGEYVARCTEASFEWARRWNAWKARLVLEPQDYRGRSYTGSLCKFLDLGRNREVPYAGSRSAFRMLFAEVNGGQPSGPEVADMTIFVGHLYRITVETVDKNAKGELLASAHWYSIVRTIHPVAPSTPLDLHNSQNPQNLPTDQPSNLVNLTPGKQRRVKDGETK